MKIAFQNFSAWDDRPHAESELARRLVKAAAALRGVDAIASSSCEEISAFSPDIVIPLHFFVPKLFDAFTIGCMWNPVYAIARNDCWDNLKSYDGYGVASPQQEQFVRALKFKSPCPYLLSVLYPSANATHFVPVEDFNDPVYIGANWDGQRQDQLSKLARNVQVYGPADRWKNLPGALYRGEIPFDGTSSLSVYRNAGIGLSFHHPQHLAEGLPCMRPFEIAASGALMISDQNPFVKEHFGDAVLYLDHQADPQQFADQLEAHLAWAGENKRQAIEMAREAHEIFTARFSLEVLLENLLHEVAEFQAREDTQTAAPEHPGVEIIVRTDNSRTEPLIRALQSIERQTYENVTACIVFFGPAHALSDLKNIIAQACPSLRFHCISTQEGADRSTNFYTGLRSCRAPFFGFLDDDDVLFRDHVETLIGCLARYPERVLAYSGSVRIWDDNDVPPGESMIRLGYFHDIDGFSSKSFITSNSYLIRRNKIPWHLLEQPRPDMQKSEDFLFLKLLYHHVQTFIFSEKVTCGFYWSARNQGNTVFAETKYIKELDLVSIARKTAGTQMSYAVSTKPKESPPSRSRAAAGLKRIWSGIRNHVPGITL